MSNNKQPKQGLNTKIEFIFVRHSQKQNSSVFAKGSTALSSSSISEAGKIRAEEFGIKTLKGKIINKAYATSFDRTKETLSAAFKAAGIKVKILQPTNKIVPSLTLSESPESKAIAIKWKTKLKAEQKKALRQNYPGKKFNQLTLDKQENIIEMAEEPVMEWYLSFKDKRPDKQTPSPREHAAFVAFKINKLIELVDSIPNNHHINIVSCGHKGSTESFLIYTLNLRSIKQIGGSLHILDSWNLKIENNSQGDKTASITIRREGGESHKYGLDINAVMQLANEHLSLVS